MAWSTLDACVPIIWQGLDTCLESYVSAQIRSKSGYLETSGKFHTSAFFLKTNVLVDPFKNTADKMITCQSFRRIPKTILWANTNRVHPDFMSQVVSINKSQSLILCAEKRNTLRGARTNDSLYCRTLFLKKQLLSRLQQNPPGLDQKVASLDTGPVRHKDWGGRNKPVPNKLNSHRLSQRKEALPAW